ncbi:hypothetical protein, partial [Ursidibacter arcticus]
MSSKSVLLDVPTIWKWQNGKWSEPIELPTFVTNTTDGHYMLGSVMGLNALGNRAVGYEIPPGSFSTPLAKVWTEEGDNWDGIRLSLEESAAKAINNKGDIVAGYTQSRASIWRHNGTDWSDTQVIDNNKSYIFVLNNAGDVAGGSSDSMSTNTDDGQFYESPLFSPTSVPTIWSGNNYSEKTILKGVDGNETYGEVRGLSADGKIAGGVSKVGENYRATIWSGNDWKAYDLGTFKQDGSGFSSVGAMNDDGTIVGGEATFEDGEIYAALWFIQYDENNKPTTDQPSEQPAPLNPSATAVTTDTEQPTDATQPSVQPAPLNPSAASTASATPATVPPVVRPVIVPLNLDFTKKSIEQFSASRFATVAQQYYGLKRLQQGCYT